MNCVRCQILGGSSSTCLVGVAFLEQACSHQAPFRASSRQHAGNVSALSLATYSRLFKGSLNSTRRYSSALFSRVSCERPKTKLNSTLQSSPRLLDFCARKGHCRRDGRLFHWHIDRAPGNAPLLGHECLASAPRLTRRRRKTAGLARHAAAMKPPG